MYEENELIVEEISAQDFAEELGVHTVYAGEKNIAFNTTNVSRPGLFLAGFMDYFGENRVQVLGNAEIEFLRKMGKEEERACLEQLLQREIPCIIVSRNRSVPEPLLELCQKYKVPLFRSENTTTSVINALVIFLNRLLAPSESRHAGLIDVYGMGILLIGKSGIGKSETALELVKRGHRLVADDSVIIKRIDDRLEGTSPELIRYFMELRGIGIIDVKSMYGVGSVVKQKDIELVIELERWEEGKAYDRLGDERQYEEILGVSLPKITIPVRPGRNLAIIIEVAAINSRLKQLGYDAAKEMINRTIG